MKTTHLNNYTALCANMATITLSVPDNIRKQMKEFDEINWSAFIRKQIERKTKEIYQIEEWKKIHAQEKEIVKFAVDLQKKTRKDRYEELKRKGLI